MTDEQRRAVALLYGANTIGGCAGVIVATFVTIERFGHRNTLWLGALVNACVAAIAWIISSRYRSSETPIDSKAAPARMEWVLPAVSGVAGFVFLLMEIVWYRELIPLVGGTTYSFGTILVVALLGLGVGGALSSLAWRSRRPKFETLALIVAAQAFFLLLPFALGDRIARVALLVHPATSIGFGARMAYMACLIVIVVFLPAVLSGIQLPVIISMAGEGRSRAGRHVGTIVGVNTIGSIAGSLAGGFGLLPLLGANGCWRLAGAMLVALTLACLMLAARDASRRAFAATSVVVIIAAIMMFAEGPPEFWRQTPIGVGRSDQAGFTVNSLRNFERFRRRTILWSRDGVESAVALAATDGLAFLVNGQADGHARFDAGTQVMSGLLGALLHPHPRSAFVVGLGTGSTAGWLGAVPGISRVDTVELEPAIIDVARACVAVNARPLQNGKVHVAIGDAREALLTSRTRYDLIASEPSNPSRSGIASFFTADFYRACASHLNDSGLFLQWLQAYEIDARTVRIVYATLLSVFPHVQTWETKRGDLLLVASMNPITMPRQEMEVRIRQEPFRTALFDVWRATTVEGVAARFIAGERVTAKLANGVPQNTDDRPSFEFSLARSLGTAAFDANDLRSFAVAEGDDVPASWGPIGRGALDDSRVSMFLAEGQDPLGAPVSDPRARVRATAGSSYLHFDYGTVQSIWSAQGPPPTDAIQIATFAEALADSGDERTTYFVEQLRRTQPIEADVVLARLRYRQGKHREAALAMSSALTAYGADPWPPPIVMTRALTLSVEIANTSRDPEVAATMFDAARPPFAAMLFNEARLAVLLQLAAIADRGRCGPRTEAALEQLGPHVPWVLEVLRMRMICAEPRGGQVARDAERDYRAYVANEPERLVPQK